MTTQVKSKMTAAEAAQLADALIAQERAKPKGFLRQLAATARPVDSYDTAWPTELVSDRQVAGARIGSPYRDLMSRSSR